MAFIHHALQRMAGGVAQRGVAGCCTRGMQVQLGFGVAQRQAGQRPLRIGRFRWRWVGLHPGFGLGQGLPGWVCSAQDQQALDAGVGHHGPVQSDAQVCWPTPLCGSQLVVGGGQLLQGFFWRAGCSQRPRALDPGDVQVAPCVGVLAVAFGQALKAGQGQVAFMAHAGQIARGSRGIHAPRVHVQLVLDEAAVVGLALAQALQDLQAVLCALQQLRPLPGHAVGSAGDRVHPHPDMVDFRVLSLQPRHVVQVLLGLGRSGQRTGAVVGGHPAAGQAQVGAGQFQAVAQIGTVGLQVAGEQCRRRFQRWGGARHVALGCPHPGARRQGQRQLIGRFVLVRRRVHQRLQQGGGLGIAVHGPGTVAQVGTAEAVVLHQADGVVGHAHLQAQPPVVRCGTGQPVQVGQGVADQPLSHRRGAHQRFNQAVVVQQHRAGQLAQVVEARLRGVACLGRCPGLGQGQHQPTAQAQGTQRNGPLALHQRGGEPAGQAQRAQAECQRHAAVAPDELAQHVSGRGLAGRNGPTGQVSPHVRGHGVHAGIAAFGLLFQRLEQDVVQVSFHAAAVAWPVGVAGLPVTQAAGPRGFVFQHAARQRRG